MSFLPRQVYQDDPEISAMASLRTAYEWEPRADVCVWGSPQKGLNMRGGEELTLALTRSLPIKAE